MTQMWPKRRTIWYVLNITDVIIMIILIMDIMIIDVHWDPKVMLFSGYPSCKNPNLFMIILTSDDRKRSKGRVWLVCGSLTQKSYILQWGRDPKRIDNSSWIKLKFKIYVCLSTISKNHPLFFPIRFIRMNRVFLINSRTAIAGAIIGLLLVFYNSKNLNCIGALSFF